MAFESNGEAFYLVYRDKCQGMYSRGLSVAAIGKKGKGISLALLINLVGSY